MRMEEEGGERSGEMEGEDEEERRYGKQEANRGGEGGEWAER